MNMPVFETARLTIRPQTVEDLEAAYRIATRCFGSASPFSHPADETAARAAFMPFAQWMELNPRILAHNPLPKPAWLQVVGVLANPRPPRA